MIAWGLTGFVLLLLIYRPVVAGRKAWALAARIYTPYSPSRQRKQKIRWAIVSACCPFESLNWFKLLEGADMRPFADRMPQLTFKPLHVYMSTKWNIPRRKKVIEDTYRLVRTYKGILQESLMREEGCVLAKFNLGEYGESSIVLSYDNGFRKEGDLMASLRCASLQGPVFTVAFSLEQLPAGNWVCYIGSVQGYFKRDKDEIKDIGKAMHGLRPKALMIFVAQEIAGFLGATNLYGVGNTIHPHLRKHLIHLSFMHDLAFDYDSLWVEAEGVPAKDGWFELPLKTERRTDKEIKPNKRSQYHRRYAMMDDLSTQIRNSLSSCIPNLPQSH